MGLSRREFLNLSLLCLATPALRSIDLMLSMPLLGGSQNSTLLLDDILSGKNYSVPAFIDMIKETSGGDYRTLSFGESHGVNEQRGLARRILTAIKEDIDLFIEEKNTFFTSDQTIDKWNQGYDKEIFDPWIPLQFIMRGLNRIEEGLLVTYSGNMHSHSSLHDKYYFGSVTDHYFSKTQDSRYRTIDESLEYMDSKGITLLMLEEDNISKDLQNKFLAANFSRIEGFKDHVPKEGYWREICDYFMSETSQKLEEINNHRIYELDQELFIYVSPPEDVKKGQLEIIENFMTVFRHPTLRQYILENNLGYMKGDHFKGGYGTTPGKIAGLMSFQFPDERPEKERRHLEIILKHNPWKERVPVLAKLFDPQKGEYGEYEELNLLSRHGHSD